MLVDGLETFSKVSNRCQNDDLSIGIDKVTKGFIKFCDLKKVL